MEIEMCVEQYSVDNTPYIMVSERSKLTGQMQMLRL